LKRESNTAQEQKWLQHDDTFSSPWQKDRTMHACIMIWYNPLWCSYLRPSHSP
jgi:hypothetical protein